MFNLKANKIGIAILSLGMTLQVSAQGKGSDSLLTTLKQELKYSMESLSKQKTAPYFMSLRLQDSKMVVVQSNLGVASADSSRQRLHRFDSVATNSTTSSTKTRAVALPDRMLAMDRACSSH